MAMGNSTASGLGASSSAKLSKTATTSSATVAQALEVARESPDGASDSTISGILEEALEQTWSKITAQPIALQMLVLLQTLAWRHPSLSPLLRRAKAAELSVPANMSPFHCIVTSALILATQPRRSGQSGRNNLGSWRSYAATPEHQLLAHAHKGTGRARAKCWTDTAVGVPGARASRPRGHWMIVIERRFDHVFVRTAHGRQGDVQNPGTASMVIVALRRFSVFG
ncbi:hypothetical protein VDGL01_12103 [Verticillium dahliae]